MPEFFLELFSEEIPARMQARAAEDLARLVGEALAALSPARIAQFRTARAASRSPRDIAAEVAAAGSTERGPRANAPEQALAGFLRKHGAAREQLASGGRLLGAGKAGRRRLRRHADRRRMPALLRRFPWPKSMRWGGTSSFTWVRPLRRIVCLLDGEVVPFDLRDGERRRARAGRRRT